MSDKTAKYIQPDDEAEKLVEFDRQVKNLKLKDIILDYDSISTLKENLKNIALPKVDLEKGILPFVIVVKSMEFLGVTKLYPLERDDFEVIESVDIPKLSIYLLLNIDRGKETLNITPKEAFDLIKEKGRSPLTLDEGVSILFHYPEFLVRNNCFSLLASRHVGDQRVPAIWINANKQPNLGWCWNGNPHTWLGSASCKSRVA